MIPANSLSTPTIPAYYLNPDNLEYSRTISYELGGVALNDPSMGLMVQTWTLQLVNIIGYTTYNVVVYDEAGVSTELFSGVNILDVSLAFDHNMRPFVAFMENGVAKFRWFDTTVNDQVITELPAGSQYPKCCMDDKRITQAGTSDIILSYVRAGNLYFRQQRDRYQVEYLLKEGVTGVLLNVGMHRSNRLQFMLGDLPDLVVTYNYRIDTLLRRRVTVSGNPRRIVGSNYV